LDIPPALRKALHLSRGGLELRKVSDSLVLERREAVESRLWKMFEKIPQDVRLADELITDRRNEAHPETLYHLQSLKG